MEFASKTAIKRLLKDLVSHPKRHLKSYPAIKIGRLGVTKTIQKSGLGKMIVNSIIELALMKIVLVKLSQLMRMLNRCSFMKDWTLNFFQKVIREMILDKCI